MTFKSTTVMFGSVHLNRGFASAKTGCSAVSCGSESSAVSPEARCCMCITIFLRRISKAPELKHGTVSIILSISPRFSEVLFSRGRHSQKTDVYVNKVLGHSVFLF